MKLGFICAAVFVVASLPCVVRAQQNPAPPIPPAVTPASPGTSHDANVVVGTVVDRSTGLPLGGVGVTAVGRSASATTDASGRFQLSLPAGVYVFEARLSGYQTAQTDNVPLVANSSSTITLSLNRAASQSGNYREIARTTVRSNDALQPAAVVQHTLSTATELANGTLRADRAIEALPNVVFSTGLTTPGIDGYIALRGLPGATQQLIDGHPTTVSLNGVALFPFQSINVIYGSGKGQLYPINAIGGVIDFRTLQPTRVPSVSLLQSFGTFNHLTSNIQATGTIDRFGYAFSLGTEGTDAPYARTTRYEPLSGWDPSATDPAVRARSFYSIDSPYSVRSGFVKLQYQGSPAFKVTASVLGSAELHLNDGDKSVDFHSYARVLADGQRNLANKDSKDTCAPGTFTATNFAGVANGTGPDGITSDGGVKCQTPQLYASLREGYTTGELGSITTQNNDNDIKFEVAGTRNYALVDIYASLFQRNQDYHSTQYKLQPGDLNGLHTKRTDDSNAGITVSDDVLFDNDDVGVGFYSNNYRQDEIGRQTDQTGKSTGGYIFNYGNDIRSYFFKEIHHSANSPLTIYAYDYIKDSQQPHAFFNDPRLAILYRRGNNTIRVAAGEGSSLPYAPDNQTYQPKAIADFTSGVNCNGSNSVGTAPTGFTRPERASDEEISFAHRWHGDSATQLEFYNENFASKVQYGYNAPLTYTGTTFFSSDAQHMAYLNAIANKCNGVTGDGLLTLQGNYNLGRQLARGIDLTGRQRVGSNAFFDYSYGTQSVAYRSLPLEVVQGDKRIIIGAQTFIPDSGAQIPLHSASLALDVTQRPGFQGRLTAFYTGPGNQSGLQGFVRTDLSLNKSFAHFGTVTAYVYNLLNYAAYYDNVNGYGVPLALNQYAAPGDYNTFFGAAAQNRYGVGPRTVVFTYQVKI